MVDWVGELLVIEAERKIFFTCLLKYELSRVRYVHVMHPSQTWVAANKKRLCSDACMFFIIEVEIPSRGVEGMKQQCSG